MTKHLYTVFFLIATNLLYSQDFIERKLDSLVNTGNIEAVLNEYELLHSNFNEQKCLNLVTCFSIIKNLDSAFYYLDKLFMINHKYSDLNSIVTSNLYFLQDDPRWSVFLKKVCLNYYSEKPIKNVIYAQNLINLAISDQSFYSQIYISKYKFGKRASPTVALWELKNIINNKNMLNLKSLINQYGYPKISEVGSFAASKSWLIIQHSDLKTQKEYLPLIKEAYKNKEALYNWIAMLTDRILLREGKPQKYGSQGVWNPNINSTVVYELEAPDSVNIWRNRYNLGPPISKKAINNMYNPNK